MKKKHVIWGCTGIGCLSIIATCLIVLLYFWAIADAFDYLSKPENRRTFYDSPSKIEEAIGIRLPNFTIKEYRPQDTLHFTGDFADTLIIEFHEKLSEDLFRNFELVAGNIGKRLRRIFYDKIYPLTVSDFVIVIHTSAVMKSL
jgi:hypothetical protein